MIATHDFKLSGTALPKNAIGMLDEICEHFVEHSDVQRNGNLALLKSDMGSADIRAVDDKLTIDLTCVSPEALQLTRTMLAEHLFYFAGDEPFELTWSEPPPPTAPANLREMTVVSSEEVTPRMRRVKFFCDDVTPFIGGDMHARLVVPKRGRAPVWPGIRDDGRLAWPKGDDALLVRTYTIRAVDVERRELWIDFLQHPAPGVATPGADFALDARPGDTVALLGPGGGDLPQAASILMVGDETALPAIARIAADAAPGTRMRAIIEVHDAQEEQSLATKGDLEVEWVHRSAAPAGSPTLAERAIKAIGPSSADTYIWVACEKADVRAVRKFMKSQQTGWKHKYVAWYWERGVAEPV